MGMLLMHPPLETHNGANRTLSSGRASFIIGMGSMQAPGQTTGHAHEPPEVSPSQPAPLPGTPRALRDADLGLRRAGTGRRATTSARDPGPACQLTNQLAN